MESTNSSGDLPHALYYAQIVGMVKREESFVIGKDYEEMHKGTLDPDFTGLVVDSKRKWKVLLNALISTKVKFTALKLAHNDLEHAGKEVMLLLIRALETQSELRSLDLSNNYLKRGPWLARIIAAAGDKITYLNLSCNCLSETQGDASRCRPFCKIKAPIEHLSVSWNGMGGDEICSLLRGATIPLREFNACANLVGNTDDGHLAVIRALDNPCFNLRIVNLTSNALEGLVIDQIHDGLKPEDESFELVIADGCMVPMSKIDE